MQEFPDTEIIVVDDGSTDDTVAHARRAGIEVVCLPGNKGPSYALNRGIERASGEIIFTLDADAEIPTNVMKIAVETLISSSCDVIGGIYKSRPGQNRISRLFELYMKVVHFLPNSVIYTGRKDPRVFGTFLGFKKQVFETERFDESIRAIYDRDFLNRLARKGYRILYSPELYVYHPFPSSVRAIAKRTWIFGIWLTVVGRRYPIMLEHRLILAIISAVILALTLFGYLAVLPLAIFAYYMRFALSAFRKKSLGVTLLQALGVAGLAILISIIDLASFPASLFIRPKHW